ncbi:MAG: UDP-N-acetylglucosamine 2-epimerase (non-hydrolyzing) [Armatimonadota bacterium]|nr:UDP-N-acetylglucosamine 2-epimerase (non-hydrolyzing) [Armatimonadota bacterium]MDR7451370.1 UDP-N-acetylglucosamine 2-epimerase (non-hydrolyzing) [Armatimonadota bacterium]MDR7466480.1 UDP-N-acetylglucosamine 2-epimerase (non-hydrolyzing) [Armatimonadota bacterium]MDR7493202.1 UDP-N-acetylglucosamine 2-epimerase (non-hydrolyzing) [Armatimonadota bacterium]MDR7499445.1 UDP-N-acetylglucosamine 2-epimerase (non-hydrolyzing) [Armatimonadota bacterium]
MAAIPIMTVFGTRPEAVKMAPVVLGLREAEEFMPIVTVTGQHREMLDQVTRLFGITPDHDLNIMLPEQSLVDITTRALRGLYRVLGERRPAMVLVQGDAHTTFVGALAAFYHRIPIGHIEAGLRTADKYQPFPEEMNRRMTTVLTDLHFAATPTARTNLLREGVPPQAVVVTGNTVIDALHLVKDRPDIPLPPGLPELRGRRLVLVTTHRRENWGEPLREIYLALVEILDRHPEVELVFSVHRNPAVRRVVGQVLHGHPRAHLIEPPDYGPWVRLMQQAYLILTDSGGIQEEATALGRPALVLRRVTERPEGVAAGTLRLVGTDRRRIVEEASRLLGDPAAYEAMARAHNPYGDGRAAERIVHALRYYFGRTSTPPEEFAG